MEDVRRSVPIRTVVTRVPVETGSSFPWMEEHVKVRRGLEINTPLTIAQCTLI